MFCPLIKTQLGKLDHILINNLRQCSKTLNKSYKFFYFFFHNYILFPNNYDYPKKIALVLEVWEMSSKDFFILMLVSWKVISHNRIVFL
jgi:hypothetical protein